LQGEGKGEDRLAVKEIIDVYSENYAKHISTFCGQIAQMMDFK
jgi:hypothetical protein